MIWKCKDDITNDKLAMNNDGGSLIFCSNFV